MNPSENTLPTISDDLLLQCMHCGMCLPTCPTYVLTKRERSSPRGRIRLIKSVAEGKLNFTHEFITEMNFCLDCRACETACPAGVHYGRIIEETRRVIAETTKISYKTRILRRLFLTGLFAKQKRLQLLARVVRFYQKTGMEWFVLKFNLTGLFSKKLKQIAPLSPKISAKFTKQLLPEFLPAHGETKYKVALLTGCVQDIAFAETNLATAEVLVRNNCDVYIPQNQACCGSVHAHTGAVELAKKNLLHNCAAFDIDTIDALIINAAGCGSFLKESGEIFSLAEDAVAIKKIASKTRDISEFLCEINFRKPETHLDLIVTYHDACHLAHGQKIRSAPREIITSINGVILKEMRESDWCCGSAGVYNITHTETANKLLDRKIRNIQSTNAEIIISANTGCSIQLAYGIRTSGSQLKIMHPIDLLWRAYQAEERNE